jgi:hypothetical protein
MAKKKATQTTTKDTPVVITSLKDYKKADGDFVVSANLFNQIKKRADKTTSIQKQLTEAKRSKKELEQNLAQVQTHNQTLKVAVANIDEDFVPKNKLKNETGMERLSWYYNDLNKTQRFAMNIGLIAAYVTLSWGVYSGVINFSGNNDAGQFIGIISGLLPMFTGLTIQGKAVFNNPKKSK